MRKKLTEKVIALLDPIGVYDIAPPDEYSNIAKHALDVLDQGGSKLLQQYLIDLYPISSEVSHAKVDLAVELIVFFKENLE
ncbi:MAG: hypothetical protein IJD47_03740 [Clostridia bacterium]|nr:hypothetical protein [Clostridia bacterium]MBQ3042290.1 hypothetical protein [Clostridia bacterium]